MNLSQRILGTLVAFAASFALVLGTAGVADAKSVRDPGNDATKGSGYKKGTKIQRKSVEIKKFTIRTQFKSKRVVATFKLAGVAKPTRNFRHYVSIGGSVGNASFRTLAYNDGSSYTVRNGKQVCKDKRGKSPVKSKFISKRKTVVVSFPVNCLPRGKKLVSIDGQVSASANFNQIGNDITDNFVPSLKVRR